MKPCESFSSHCGERHDMTISNDNQKKKKHTNDERGEDVNKRGQDTNDKRARYE